MDMFDMFDFDGNGRFDALDAAILDEIVTDDDKCKRRHEQDINDNSFMYDDYDGNEDDDTNDEEGYRYFFELDLDDDDYY